MEKKMTKINIKRSFNLGWYDDNLWSYRLIQRVLFIKISYFYQTCMNFHSPLWPFFWPFLFPEKGLYDIKFYICFGPGQEINVFCVWIFNVPCLTDTMFVQFKRRLSVDGIRSVCIKLVIFCDCIHHTCNQLELTDIVYLYTWTWYI